MIQTHHHVTGSYELRYLKCPDCGAPPTMRGVRDIRSKHDWDDLVCEQCGRSYWAYHALSKQDNEINGRLTQTRAPEAFSPNYLFLKAENDRLQSQLRQLKSELSTRTQSQATPDQGTQVRVVERKIETMPEQARKKLQNLQAQNANLTMSVDLGKQVIKELRSQKQSEPKTEITPESTQKKLRNLEIQNANLAMSVNLGKQVIKELRSQAQPASPEKKKA